MTKVKIWQQALYFGLGMILGQAAVYLWGGNAHWDRVLYGILMLCIYVSFLYYHKSEY